MSDYMQLIGADKVSEAGRAIGASAGEFQRSVAYLDEILMRHQAFLDDWLNRLERVLGEKR